MTNKEVRRRIQDAKGEHNDLTEYGEEAETRMVGPHLKILCHGDDKSPRDSERRQKARKTEGEIVRRQ